MPPSLCPVDTREHFRIGRQRSGGPMRLWCRSRSNLSLNRMGRHLPAQARGFTHVELLVVIGIIAVMISILLSTLGKARESAPAAKCLNNLRQISIAAITFPQENNGW